jgi:hypothetical protein
LVKFWISSKFYLLESKQARETERALNQQPAHSSKFKAVELGDSERLRLLLDINNLAQISQLSLFTSRLYHENQENQFF